MTSPPSGSSGRGSSDPAAAAAGVVDLDEPIEVFDPLPPADDAIAGCVDVEESLRNAKRVSVYLSEDAIGPTVMTRAQVLDLIERTRTGIEPVILTARVEGSDLVIRTLEILPASARASATRRRTIGPSPGRQPSASS